MSSTGLRLSVWTALCLAVASLGYAATTSVSTSDTLAAALAHVNPGDEIVLRDGVYTGKFALDRAGEPGKPIVVRAEHPRRATFDGVLFQLGGNHGVLTDLVFEGSQVTVSGDHNRVAHSLFRRSDARPEGMNAAVRMIGGASHNRIHHNELTEWSTYGFRVIQPNERMTGNRIDHNHIHDYSNLRSNNEPEAIQIGSNNSVTHLQVATLIERNLIERVRIRGELLSLKTSGNVVRDNTFVDNEGAVQGRHGVNNTFRNNTLLKAGPLRAYGDRHQLIGNRLVDCDVIIPSGDVTQENLRKPDGRGGHPAARHQLVAANILEGTGRILVGRGNRADYAIPAEATTLAGNVGPVVTEGAELKHVATRLLPGYEGDAGKAVPLTREQVGPGAPDVLVVPAVATAGWEEDFAGGISAWWSEGGERVWVEEGRLHVKADAPQLPGGGVNTVWCRRALPADFELELEAHVVSSSTDVNNINLFFCYSDPSGRPLEETRESRSSAAYNLYHQLNGYIATFVKEAGAARIRLRRNPGFTLLAEERGGESRGGVTYRLRVRKRAGEIVFSVDGREITRVRDPHPWSGGLLGLRTFRTNLWWDNIRVRSLERTGAPRAE